MHQSFRKFLETLRKFLETFQKCLETFRTFPEISNSFLKFRKLSSSFQVSQGWLYRRGAGDQVPTAESCPSSIAPPHSDRSRRSSKSRCRRHPGAAEGSPSRTSAAPAMPKKSWAPRSRKPPTSRRPAPRPPSSSRLPGSSGTSGRTGAAIDPSPGCRSPSSR